MSEDFEQIRYAVADGVLTITLNRPERLNAWTPTMQRELIEAFDRADADDDVRAIVVTGEGRGVLRRRRPRARAARPSTGGRARATATPARRRRPVRRCASSSRTKPVIAAINGPAVGVGMTMTLPMDVRLVAEGAKLGFVFARRGIVPEACSSWFLPRIVGISRAMEWVSTGRVFGARGGAGGRAGPRACIPPDELLPAAYALAREIADNAAPVSVALARRLLWTGLGLVAPDGGPPRRLARDVRPRPVRRRARGHRLVPGEAPAGVPRPRRRRRARRLPWLEDPVFE